MNIWKAVVAWGFGILLPAGMWATEDVPGEFEAFREQSMKEFEAFRQKANDEFEQFRRKANEDYADFLARPWTPMELTPAEKAPVRPSPVPVYEEPKTQPAPEVKPMPVVVRDIVKQPKPAPQPSPVEPVREIVSTDPVAVIGERKNPVKPMVLEFYGREAQFRTSGFNGLRLHGNTGRDFADGWKQLNSDATNNLILDCLNARDNLRLCDWAYLQMIDKLAGKLTNSENEKTLLTGFIFCQSGYKMRFARSTDGRLHLFYAPTGIVYDTPRLNINGDTFYQYDKSGNAPGGYEVCDFTFPKEQNMSFAITRIPDFGSVPSQVRSVTAKHHPEVKTAVAVNKNLIDFYNSYPDATLTKDPNSRWLIHTGVPVSPELKSELYPVLREAIAGKNQKDAANIIINFAESFPYGFDEEIWGKDRAFFPDESWFYPKSDCEDHAIHFSRLVRDLMGLKVALVLYDNHLAAAVAFTEDVPGDYVMFNGRKYTICDPTIFYANVGKTMRGMDNQSAVLIDLQ